MGEAKKKTRFADEDDEGGQWETVLKKGTGPMTLQVSGVTLQWPWPGGIVSV